jgi:hypothetical protein
MLKCAALMCRVIAVFGNARFCASCPQHHATHAMQNVSAALSTPTLTSSDPVAGVVPAAAAAIRDVTQLQARQRVFQGVDIAMRSFFSTGMAVLDHLASDCCSSR